VHADSARSGIDHGNFAALKIKDAIVDQFRERTGADRMWTPSARTSPCTAICSATRRRCRWTCPATRCTGAAIAPSAAPRR
jgi:hypothetical protein